MTNIDTETGKEPMGGKWQRAARDIEFKGFSACCGAWVVEISQFSPWAHEPMWEPDEGSVYIVSSHYLARLLVSNSSNDDFTGMKFYIPPPEGGYWAEARLLTVLSRVRGGTFNRRG